MHRSARLRPSLAAAAWLPALARAADAAPVPEIGASLAQMLAGLAVVLLALFAGLHLVKRLAGPRGGAAGLLRVVAATPVGPRERVVVVEMGDTWVMLGVAPGQVSTLHTLPRQALPAPPPAPAARAAGDFAARLAGMLEGSRRGR